MNHRKITAIVAATLLLAAAGCSSKGGSAAAAAGCSFDTFMQAPVHKQNRS